jgi:hypothetical protein
MQMSDFIFTPYESRRHVKPLIDVCWFSGWLRCRDEKEMHLPERVLRQYGYVQTIPRDPAASAPSSMTWYHKVSHPKMLRLEAHKPPPEPPHLEVLIEQQTRGEVRDTFQIYNNARLELERSIRDGEAVRGTLVYDTINRVLSMVNPATVYLSRRRRPGAPVYPYNLGSRATQ